MIRFKQYLTEKESTDVKFRKEAVAYYNKLKKYLSPKEMEREEGMTRNTFGGFTIESSWIGANKYKDLTILLISNKDNPNLLRGGFGKKKTGKGFHIVLYSLWDRWDAKNIGSRLTGFKEDFIHEFIHYKDAKRYKDKTYLSNLNLVKRIEKSGYSAYYNTPGEFNAYYQEKLELLLTMLKKIPKEMRTEKLSSVTIFSDWLKTSLFDKNFIKELDKKFTRKLDKRIADLYTELKKKYEKKS